MKVKSKNVVILDKIQNAISDELKEIGYKKVGRTFNKTIDRGLVQVINFQMGLRGMEGLFTVNLGVYIEELDEIRTTDNKLIKKEHD